MQPIFVASLGMAYVTAAITLMIYVGGVRLFLIDFGWKISTEKFGLDEKRKREIKKKLSKQTEILNNLAYVSIAAAILGLLRLVFSGCVSLNPELFFFADLLLILVLVFVLGRLSYLHYIVNKEHNKSESH